MPTALKKIQHCADVSQLTAQSVQVCFVGNSLRRCQTNLGFLPKLFYC